MNQQAALKKKDFATVPAKDMTAYLHQHGLTAGMLLAVMFVPNNTEVLVAKTNKDDEAHAKYEVTFDDGKTEGRNGAFVLAAIDVFGNKCIATAGKGLEFCKHAPEAIGDIKNAVLNEDTNPNLILAAPRTETNVYLVDGGSMTTLALQDGTELSFARVIDRRKVLATAKNKLFAGKYNGESFTWTQIGATKSNIVWLGRVDGNYVTAALEDGTQILLEGIETIGGDQAKLEVLETIDDDKRSPVGKVAGTDTRFAMVDQGSKSAQVHFTPPSGKGASKIATAMTTAATS